MATVSNTPMMISKQAQAALVQYSQQCTVAQNINWDIRGQLLRADLAYIRENDLTKENVRARVANAYGDSNKFQNITVPVVMPQVEAAVTYQTSVFLTGVPIFGVVSGPQNMDAALQMETAIDDQATKGQWVSQFQKGFRDGFKYNLGALEVCWGRKVTPAFETDLEFSAVQGKPKEVIWEGNIVKHLDMYNTFWDKSVKPCDVYKKGEFAGYNELKSRIELKTFINELPDKMIDNITKAFESGAGFVGTSDQGYGFYIPQINPNALVNTEIQRYGTNWMTWAGIAGAEQKIQYKDNYVVTTLYAKILPADFGLKVPAPNTPQVWKFIFVNNQVLIYAERQTNAHGYLPILFIQPNDDGLGYQTKALAANVMPIQDITSALWNGVIAARRRAISDRVLYDPSRITQAHIDSDNPSAKIPVRPAAYGKNVAEAVYAFPFRDDQSSASLQETGVLMQMADKISGQNPVRQGQFVKGNKTRAEFNSVMGNANGRDQVVSLLLEDQLFTPLKEILKINILQYQGGVSLYNRAKKQVITIDPVLLRKSVLEFKISDGLTPSAKLIGADVLQTAFQVIGSSPQINQQYNIGPLFSYLIKTQGTDISEFEKSPEQVAYEQAIAQWQGTMQMFSKAMEKLQFEEMQAMMKQLPPQPTPDQFGYVPAQQGSAPGTPVSQPKVSNITNNITNNVER